MAGEVLSPPDEEHVAVIVYVPAWAELPHGTGPLSPLVAIENRLAGGDFAVETEFFGFGPGGGVAPGT